MSIARHELRAAEPDPKRSGRESADAPWLARALELSSSVQTWMPRRGLRKLAGSADWRPGVSVVVSQMEWPTSRVDHAVQSIVRAARQITEPFELILVPASGQPEIAPPGARFRVQRLRAVAGGGFVQGVKRALAAARYDWIYLLDPSIEIEAETIKEALRYRAPQVFAIGSRIEGNGATGWNDARLTGDVIVPYAAKPEESGLARGNLYADGRAALYRRAALGAVLDPGERYLAPRWNDLEWGIRAWRAGYEVLFCPNSRVRQVNSGAAQSPNARRRDQIQFDLRNAWTSLQPGKLTRMATQGDAKTHAGLWQFGNACQVFLSRLKASAAPVRDLPWSHLRTKYYPNPWRPGDTRPTILVAAPYALFPPTHGGAHRIHRLLDRVARHYRVILLSDEPQAYAEESAPYLAYLGAVHFAGGRRESPSAEPERIARMKSHSHDSLANELSRLVAVYHPRLVQIEYMELALLARRRQGRTPWLLTLHDCLLTGAVEPTREDRFERDWIGRFDHLIVCGEEDAALLPGFAGLGGTERSGHTPRRLHAIGRVPGHPVSGSVSLPAELGWNPGVFARGVPGIAGPGAGRAASRAGRGGRGEAGGGVRTVPPTRRYGSRPCGRRGAVAAHVRVVGQPDSRQPGDVPEGDPIAGGGPGMRFDARRRAGIPLERARKPDRGGAGQPTGGTDRATTGRRSGAGEDRGAGGGEAGGLQLGAGGGNADGGLREAAGGAGKPRRLSAQQA
jgi:hypothetical protein